MLQKQKVDIIRNLYKDVNIFFELKVSQNMITGLVKKYWALPCWCAKVYFFFRHIWILVYVLLDRVILAIDNVD